MDSLLAVWETIVAETISSQEQDGPNKGLVKNFLLKDFYLRETAFAAKIFAAEHLRTGKPEYRQKALDALAAVERFLNSRRIEDGVDEPAWTPRGIVFRKGSIPATILLVEAAVEAAKMLDVEFRFDSAGLLSYLMKCHLGGGRFYHDIVPGGGRHSHIVNTTAMAYYFLESNAATLTAGPFSGSGLALVRNALLNSMRADGFFPYREPSQAQRLLFAISGVLPPGALKVYNRILDDSSIFFGDGLHHAISLYYYCKGRRLNAAPLPPDEKAKAAAAWSFIKGKLIKESGGHLRFDFSWEPKPYCLRHCNFIDTTTYFYIIDMLPLLEGLGIISKEDESRYRDGLLLHIEKSLLRQDATPSIDPYEGPKEIFDKILPRPAESVFHKGACLANSIARLAGGS